jgi:hypothetical protein
MQCGSYSFLYPASATSPRPQYLLPERNGTSAVDLEKSDEKYAGWDRDVFQQMEDNLSDLELRPKGPVCEAGTATTRDEATNKHNVTVQQG